MPKKKLPPKDQRVYLGQQAIDVATRLDLPRPLVKRVLDTYRDYLIDLINAKDDFVILELIRVVKQVVPAAPERPGYNGLLKMHTMIKAKPASVRLRLTPSQKLKLALRLTPAP